MSWRLSDGLLPLKQPDKLGLFIDRNTGWHSLKPFFESSDYDIAYHDSYFPQDTDDKEWIPQVAQKGWCILSADKRMLKNVLELYELAKSRTYVFIFTCVMTRRNRLNIIESALPNIEVLIRTQKPRGIYKIHQDGSMHLFDPLPILKKKLSQRNFAELVSKL